MATRKTQPAAPRIRSARSLHIGLNAVHAEAYGGWTGPLVACEFDARDMAALARRKGMKARVLLTKKARRAATLAALRDAAAALQPGDLFFLSYSGHGGQVPDLSGEEADRQDETWCLYDGQLIDDELYFELGRFAAGVRILVLSDSCHSGTVTREAAPAGDSPADPWSRQMPAAVARRTYTEHAAYYDQLQRDLAAVAGTTAEPAAASARLAVGGRLAAIARGFRPKLLLISGCQDNQTSLDGERNGAFTGQLLKVWDRGAFDGNYASFHARIRARLPASQSPNLFTLGAVGGFLAQRPFSV
jgi:metacaspase-1